MPNPIIVPEVASTSPEQPPSAAIPNARMPAIIQKSARFAAEALTEAVLRIHGRSLCVDQVVAMKRHPIDLFIVCSHEIHERVAAKARQSHCG